jgi:hypothetical protein
MVIIDLALKTVTGLEACTFNTLRQSNKLAQSSLEKKFCMKLDPDDDGL